MTRLVDAPALGVDGCRKGWVAAYRKSGDVDIGLFSSFSELVAASPKAIVAVDMPIGLPEQVTAGGRGPEQAVRPFLGQRQSSVFSIPSRSAVYAGDYGEACRLAQATSDPPRKVSRQGFGLFAKIREIDALLRLNESLRRRIHESHPEFAFATLNGGRAMELPKKIKGRINPAGMQERLEMLARFDIAPDVLARPRPAGAGDDDVLDACACLLVAERILAGLARPWPDPPGVDNHGLLVAIWA